MTQDLRAGNVDTRIVSMRPWRRVSTLVSRYRDARHLLALAENSLARIVHASDLWKSAYALHLHQRLEIPSVVHVRGPLLRRDILKHRLPQATALIPIAQRYATDLLHAGIAPEKIMMIDDAVDLEKFSPDAAGHQAFREAQIPAGLLAVGLAGRIEPFKRILEFLDVVGLVKEKAPGRAVFLLMGEPGPADYMRRVHERIEKLQIADCVRLLNRRSDMSAVLAALDVLVTMSGGSVMFEAMATAKPVLSVRVDTRPSIHTRHDETALCITTREPQPAAEALLGLLGDASVRARLGAAARAHVKAQLSIPHMVLQTEALYDRLLRRAV